VRGALPDFDLALARRDSRAYGKAVVFARRDVMLGDTRPWLEDATVRDVPHPGERIRAGQPVCTVFADAAESGECHAALVRRADCVYQELARWEREIA
jgi:predicted ATP-grasp superfamily ATP-dependent carboligase